MSVLLQRALSLLPEEGLECYFHKNSELASIPLYQSKPGDSLVSAVNHRHRTINQSVKTKIITKRNVEIPIEYRMLKKNNRWVVYDVIIEGVSLVNNYRNQFNKIIRKDSYEELVKRMKNKQEEEKFDDKQ